MTEENLMPDRNAAGEALKTARDLQAASRQRSLPSPLLSLTVSAVISVLCWAVVASRTELVALSIIALAGLMLFNREKTGVEAEAVPRNPSDRRKFIFLVLGVVVLMVAAMALHAFYAQPWIAVATGVVMGVLTLLLMLLERRNAGDLGQKGDDS